MEKEILNAIVEMVKQGGQLAVWGVFVYLFMQILKVAVTGGILWGLIRTLCSTLLAALELHHNKKVESVSLLSDKVSSTLTAALEDYHRSITAILRDLDAQLKRCETNSENTGKPQV